MAALAAYSWWATGLRPFGTAATLATAGAGAAAIVLGGARRRRSGAGGAARAPSRAAPGADMLWVGLVACLAAWELAAWLQHPRAEHPTLSSLSGALLDHHAWRAVAFAGWTTAAAHLASR